MEKGRKGHGKREVEMEQGSVEGRALKRASAEKGNKLRTPARTRTLADRHARAHARADQKWNNPEKDQK
eukprot:5734959-Pleurochrysis_carterae.AAC.1